jgi:Flp pilus assembly protein TadG
MRGLGRLLHDTRGVGLVEFAIAFPILLSLYLGCFVLSDMIAAKRKVAVAARELTDVSSRFIALQNTDVTTIMTAIAQEMAPYSTSQTMVRISEVQICPGGATAQVVWSRALNGTALATGSTVTLTANLFNSGSALVPASQCSAGAYFMLGEVSYPYKPAVGYGTITTTTLYDSALLSPRASGSIAIS